MEELCNNSGGYTRFFRALLFQYFTWYIGILCVPAVFWDHHRCEVRQPWAAWLLYAGVILAMAAFAVLSELSTLQKMGLLQGREVTSMHQDRRWRIPLALTLLWKLDTYTDVAFIFVARDCGSTLWWASLATVIFGIVFCQLILNLCFACTDCDHELPPSFGFVMLDFKLVNAAIHQILPFDPDVTHLPVARPVTLNSAAHLVGVQKLVGDVAQVSIQGLFLGYAQYSHGFVHFSILVSALHGGLTLLTVLGECVQDERKLQCQSLHQGVALKPFAGMGPDGFPTLPLQPLQHMQPGQGGGDRNNPYGSFGAQSPSNKAAEAVAAPAAHLIGKASSWATTSVASSSVDPFDPNEAPKSVTKAPELDLDLL